MPSICTHVRKGYKLFFDIVLYILTILSVVKCEDSNSTSHSTNTRYRSSRKLLTFWTATVRGVFNGFLIILRESFLRLATIFNARRSVVIDVHVRLKKVFIFGKNRWIKWFKKKIITNREKLIDAKKQSKSLTWIARSKYLKVNAKTKTKRTALKNWMEIVSKSIVLNRLVWWRYNDLILASQNFTKNIIGNKTTTLQSSKYNFQH